MSNTQLTQAPQKPKFSVAVTMPTYQKLINNTLGDPDRARRFVASVTSAVSANPALQECDAASTLSSALLGESLNLSPSPQLGQYYLVPFNDKKSDLKKAQFILGYKGYIQLAIRSGNYADIDAIEIREGEYKGRDKNTGKPVFEFIEDDKDANSVPVVGYMAYFEYLNGFRKVMYWSREKMMSHADKYSKAFSAKAYKDILDGKISDKDMWKYSSFWYKDFDGMAKKTLIRQLISKWGIMSIEMQTALESDDRAVITHGDGIFTEDTIPMTETTSEEPHAPEQTDKSTGRVRLSDF